MSDQIKLDEDGNCPSCGDLSQPMEQVQCFACKKLFHGVCSSVSADTKIATKTMIASFLQASTKNNFMFLCDKCLTNLEVNMAQCDSKRIDVLEAKMSNIDNNLKELTSLLKSEKESTKSNNRSNKTQPKTNMLPKDNIWNDSEKLATVKAPPTKAVLVINNNEEQQKNLYNQNVVEKAVVDNQISLSEAYTNKSGDLVLVCDSMEARDELKTLVQSAN